MQLVVALGFGMICSSKEYCYTVVGGIGDQQQRFSVISVVVGRAVSRISVCQWRMHVA